MPNWSMIREDIEFIAGLENFHDHVKALVAEQQLAGHPAHDTPMWNQSHWGHLSHCGTTACLAGWHLLRNGYTLDGSVYRDKTGQTVSATHVTTRDYDLDLLRAGKLFSPSQSIEGMRVLVDKWEKADADAGRLVEALLES